ncbi:MAG: hypothetical protein ABL888_03565, partial [Pirellulaceae bacterium]
MPPQIDRGKPFEGFGGVLDPASDGVLTWRLADTPGQALIKVTASDGPSSVTAVFKVTLGPDESGRNWQDFSLWHGRNGHSLEPFPGGVLNETTRNYDYPALEDSQSNPSRWTANVTIGPKTGSLSSNYL